MVKESTLNNYDLTKIRDDVDSKKAMPELILKQNILNAQDLMLLSERTLMNNYRRYNKYFIEDKIQLEGNIILLFGFIKQMIKDIGIKPEEKRHRMLWNTLVQMEFGKSQEVRVLLSCKNFLLYWLHKINITNLFQSTGKSFKEELEDEW